MQTKSLPGIRKWLVLPVVFASVAIGSCGSEPDNSIPQLTACEEAFAVAASVDEMRDTPRDLFPAFSACKTIEEFKAARAKFPKAMGIDDAVVYGLNSCAGWPKELAGTPICVALNRADAESPLKPSELRGLLNVPLPEGAKLVEQMPGDPAHFQDSMQRYSIDAKAEDIANFYRRELPAGGWSRSPYSTDTYFTYMKGEHAISISIEKDGRAFKLMGS